jgi:hypothetical protein
MKRSGRASLVVVVTLALVAAVVVLFLFAGESPTGVAGKFLVALAKGNTKELAELSYMEGLTEAQIEQKWKQTHAAAKFWPFAFQLKEANMLDDSNATVRLDWVKNTSSPSAFGEKYELPMVKRDGKWKVDVRGISRDMYPALPR